MTEDCREPLAFEEEEWRETELPTVTFSEYRSLYTFWPFWDGYLGFEDY